MKFGWASLVLALLLAGGCSNPNLRSYRIADRWFPDRFDPWHDETNGNALFFSILYYPLFSYSSSGTLQSQFLDLKTSSALGFNFQSFRMCLLSNLKFSDGSSVTVEDLEVTIRETHAYRKDLAPLRTLGRSKTEQNCLNLELDYAETSYFDKMTSYRSTILKKSSITQKIPIGLGPYRVVSLSEKNLMLEQTPNQVPGDLKRLEFVIVDLRTSPPELLKSIDDWNYYSASNLPESLTQGFQSMIRIVPKTREVHVVHPNKQLRKSFIDCFDRRAFVEAMGSQIRLHNSLIPSEVPLAPPTRKEGAQSCYFPNPRPKLVYYHYFGAIEPIRKFFANAGNKLPVDVSVQSYSVGDANRAWEMERKGIFAGAVEADRLAPEAYFAGMLSPKFKRFHVSGLEVAFRKISAEENLQKKQELISKAVKLIDDAYFQVYLGQPVRTYYFRPDLENIQLVNSASPYPQFHLIKTRPRWQKSLSSMLGLITQ